MDWMTGGDSSLHDSRDCFTITLYSMVSRPKEVLASQDQVPVSPTLAVLTTSVLE